MATGCTIRLLGGFGVEVDGRTVEARDWGSRRGADLVKVLALARGHRLLRDQIVEALWPELAPDAGAANLRKAVHFARRALGTDDGVHTEGGTVTLWPAVGLQVDLEEFETTAQAALRDDDTEAAERAAATYAGDLLPDDLYAPWTDTAREHARALYLDVLRRAGRWETVVDLDPLDEPAHRALMQVYLEAGDRQAAMRQFERLRKVLADELGVSPDRHTVALYERVLAEEGTEPATPSERARAHIAAGLVALNRGDFEEAAREARVARDIAVESGLGRELGESSGLLGMAAHARGKWREHFRGEFEDTLREAPDLAGYVLDAQLCFAEFSVHGSDPPSEIERFANELAVVAESHESKAATAMTALMIGEAQLLAGRLDEARASTEKAVALNEEAGALSGRALALTRAAEIAFAQADREKGDRLLADARIAALNSSLASHLLVRVLGTKVAAAPDTDRASLEMAEAERQLAGLEVCDPCSMAYRVASAIASARAGRLEEAGEWLERAERVAGMWQGGPWGAAVWEARGELRLAEGSSEQAAAMFREAAEMFGRFGHSLSEVRCRQKAESLGAHSG